VNDTKAKKQHTQFKAPRKIPPALTLPQKSGQMQPSPPVFEETPEEIPGIQLNTVRKILPALTLPQKSGQIQSSPPVVEEVTAALPIAPPVVEEATAPLPVSSLVVEEATARLPIAPPVVEEAPVPLPIAHKQQKDDTLIRLIAICVAPVAVNINFTNYGPLIPLLQNQLHVDSGQIGLFSTLVFLGLALTNIPGGILSDRFGSRTTMLGALVLVSAGSLLFPFAPTFTGMAICRAMIGLGAGAALVAGSHATAELRKYEALGQGLNGGVALLGSGLGLFATPQLLGLLGWRGALFVSGLLGVVAFLVWLLIPARATNHASEGHEENQKANPALGLRTPAIWQLGFTNMGTLGLSNAIAAWLAVYFTSRFNLPLALAAELGSLGLFAGIIFRPLGGILLARTKKPLVLIRLGTITAFLGVGVLALPIMSLPLALVGLFLVALGTTLPYAAIFSTAAAVGRARPIGQGVAQGLIAVLASPLAIAGPPIIGLFFEQTHNFTSAFGVIALTFSVAAVVASWLLKMPQRQAALAIQGA
jgi:nitrate/nitrite transporter NarK